MGGEYHPVAPDAVNIRSVMSASPPPTFEQTGTPRGRPPLHRNQACKECRKKKVKCDAIRPICTPCQKSALVYGKDFAEKDCSYPTAQDALTYPLQPGKRKTVASLESRIRELELQVDQQSSALARYRSPDVWPDTTSPLSAACKSREGGSPNGWNSGGSQGYSPPTAVDPGLPLSSQQYVSVPTTAQAQFLPASYSQPPAHVSPPPPSVGLPPPPLPGPSAAAATAVFACPAPMRDPIFDILYTGWPQDLPSLATVVSFTNAFFRSGLVATRMINASRLLASLNLPPASPEFPHPSLLHAICAITAAFIPPENLQPRYWGDEDSASVYHAQRAKKWAEREVGISQGRRLLQVCQALHLVSLQSFSSANFLDAWNSIGSVMRLVPPLGLNHLDMYSISAPSKRIGTAGGGSCSKPALLPPPESPDELLERTVTFWQAFCCDRFMAACTGWAVSMDESDITSPLPDLQALGTPAPSCLDPESPQFFAEHCMGSALAPLQLATKGAILLGRVATFLQRAGKATLSPYSSAELAFVDAAAYGCQVPQSAPLDADIRQTPAFSKLDTDLRTLRQSIARDYSVEALERTGQREQPDPFLVGAMLIPHAAVILLHESFITSKTDPSTTRAYDSARAISHILNVCTHMGGVQFLSLSYPFVNFCWTVAGRTLVREVGYAMKEGNDVKEQLARREIEVILEALKPFAKLSSLGNMCDSMIRGMLQNPSASLP